MDFVQVFRGRGRLVENMNWVLNNLPAIIISTVSLIISVKSWYKTRVFYGIEVFELHHTDHFGWLNKDLQEKLATGKYTILNTYKDEAVVIPENHPLGSWDKKMPAFEKKDKVFVLLGKIKK